MQERAQVLLQLLSHPHPKYPGCIQRVYSRCFKCVLLLLFFFGFGFWAIPCCAQQSLLVAQGPYVVQGVTFQSASAQQGKCSTMLSLVILKKRFGEGRVLNKAPALHMASIGFISVYMNPRAYSWL